MSPDQQLARVRAACEATLQQNWREGTRREDDVRFAYTSPSPGHYPWQFYWDSCFTAITWRHFDAARSRRELQSLLATQREDGFIGHTIFWDIPLTGFRRFTYNVTSADAQMTSSIQPPLLAWAWHIAVGDPAQVPGIGAHHRWLEANRDLDGDGLIWILQPDESGLDASPQFDVVWGRCAHGLPGFVKLVHRNRRLGYDLRRVVAAGQPVCCEVMTNVLYSLSRSALGLPSLTGALIERMYDDRAGLFRPLVRPQPRRPAAVTWTALSPLALPDLPEEIGHRLVREHLLNPARFWLPFPPPSVAVDDPSFSTDDRRLFGPRRYWRGPTWINSAWLLWLGLIRLGYEEQAHQLADRICTVVLRQGLREYYHPRTGAGMGAVNFGWSTLVMELATREPRTRTSYLAPRRQTPAD